MTEGARYRVARSDIDGVPVVWADHEEEHPMVSLQFRAGPVDEAIQTRGLTHLIEHVALGIGRRPFEYNGTVLDSRTVLWARGTPDQLVEFVRVVCANLSPDHIDDELVGRHTRVLRTESGSKGTGWVAELKAERFGPRGPGLERWREFGLHWLGSEEARAWTSRYFNRSNVSVWMNVPPPPGLRFELEEGERQPVPQFQPLELTYPMAFPWQKAEVAFTTLVPRDAATRAAWTALESAAQHDLRHERALTYHVFGLFEPIDAAVAHQSFSVDCLHETAGEVRDGVLALIEQMRTQGPSDEEMRWVHHWFELGFSDRMASSWLDYLAVVDLYGGPPDAEIDRLRADYAALDAASVAEAFDASMRHALMRTPDWLDPPAGWNPFPGWHDAAVTGREFEPSATASKDSPTATIVVADEGVSEVWPNDDVATVRFDQCAGIGWDSDGYRILWGFDRSWVTIDPRVLTRGNEAVALVDRLASSDLYVPLEGAAPASRVPEPPVESRQAELPPGVPGRPDLGQIAAPPGAEPEGRVRQLVTRLIKRSGTKTTSSGPPPST